MNEVLRSRALIVGVAILVLAVGLLILSSQEWMFAPPQTWLFYHQTLIAALFAVFAAIISIGGLWLVTERQIQFSIAKEQREKNLAVSGIARLIFMDAANALEVCRAASADLKRDPKQSIIPQTPKMLYLNYFQELLDLPGELGGSFLQMMNRFEMFEGMLGSDLTQNDPNFPDVRMAFSHVIMIEAYTIQKWLEQVQIDPEASLTRDHAIEMFLTPEQLKGYNDNRVLIRSLQTV